MNEQERSGLMLDAVCGRTVKVTFLSLPASGSQPEAHVI